MRAVLTVRVLTAMGIIAVCGLAIYRGWNIADFAHAQASRLAPHEQPETLRPWLGFPGIGDLAAAASLSVVTDASDNESVRKRADGLADFLAQRPAGSAAWLSLAAMRRIIGRPFGEVLAALTMSWVMGPNEESVMWQRGVFGISQWRLLTADARQRTIHDVAGAILGTLVGEDELALARNALGGQSREVRQEIMARVRAEGVPVDIIARLTI
jgi:hypothetical protein